MAKDYTINYVESHIYQGANETSCEVLDGATVIHRFSVIGYADEAGRDEMAKGMLAGWIAASGYGKPEQTHPAMKASLTVADKDLAPKVAEIG